MIVQNGEKVAHIYNDAKHCYSNQKGNADLYHERHWLLAEL